MKQKYIKSVSLILVAVGSSTAAQGQQAQLLVLDGTKVVRYNYPTAEPVSHFVGQGLTSLNDSFEMVYGPDGNLYVSSAGTDSVLRFNGQTGQPDPEPFIKPGAGGLDVPTGLAFGNDGKFYLASFATDSVLQYNAQTGAFLKIFVLPGAGTLDGANDIQFDGEGHLWVCSSVNNKLLRFNGVTGAFLSAATFQPGKAVDWPWQLYRDPQGRMFVGCDSSDNIFVQEALGGEFKELLAGLNTPGDMWLSPEGWLMVGSRSFPAVYGYDRQTGAFQGQFVFANSAGGLTGAGAIAFVPQVASCYADCDGNGSLNIDDFICFQTYFVLGC